MKVNRINVLVFGLLGLFLSLPLFAQDEAQIDNISIYLEESGSNSGFYEGDITDSKLKSVIWNIVDCANSFAGDGVAFKVGTIKDDEVETSDETDRYEALSSAIARAKEGGDSEFEKCFAKLIELNKQNGISIFITDFWLDVGDKGKESTAYKTYLSGVFDKHFALNKGLLVYHGNSSFDGIFYTSGGDGFEYKGDRPFFMFVLGSNENILTFQQGMSACQKDIDANFFNSGIAILNEQPLDTPILSISAPLKANHHFEGRQDYKLHYPNNESIDTLDKEPITLGVKIKCGKFENEPQMCLGLRTNSNQDNLDAIITDPSNWELSDSINFHLDSIRTFSPIKDADFVDSNYSHFVHVSIDTTVWKKTKEVHEESLDIIFKQRAVKGSQTDSLSYVQSLNELINNLDLDIDIDISEIIDLPNDEQKRNIVNGKVHGIKESFNAIIGSIREVVSSKSDVTHFKVPIKIINRHYQTSECLDEPRSWLWLILILILISLFIAWKISSRRYSS